MKLKLLALLLVTGLAAARRAEAGALSASGVAVLDGTAAPRASFTNSERISFQQRVYNAAAGTGRITFTFIVLSPSGSEVFQIAGNSVPGSVGNAATQISGFPISKFYAGPGPYTLKAQAALDGQVIEQQSSFVVSSPNLLLIYPPNGAQGISDLPLTFRWSSSGGSSYRVTLGDNPSFYNSLYTQQTLGGETFLSYPTNPPDPRQRLTAGQQYYWKVEALDAAGTKVAQSAMPFSFSVQTAALAKDMAVVELAVSGQANAQGSLPFRVAVKNQGGTAQSNVALRMSVGGVAAAGTPVTIAVLGPGESREYTFAAALPTGMDQSLSIACVEFSDDNLNNNCKTLMVNRPPPPGDGPIGFGGSMTADQIWQAIQQLLRDQGTDLSEYDLVGMEGQLSGEELRALLDSLRSGQVDFSLSGPPVLKGEAASAAVAGSAAAKSAKEAQGGPAAAAYEEPSAAVGEEWSGLAPPVSPDARGVVIKDPRVWRKMWKHFGRGRMPNVDFDAHMVIGMIAGKSDRVDTVEIEPAQMSLSGLVVRYRLIVHRRLVEQDGIKRAAMRTTIPYVFRVAVKSEVPVQFEAVESPE